MNGLCRYRGTGEILRREEFEARKEAVEMAQRQKLHNKPKKLTSAQKDLTGCPILQVNEHVPWIDLLSMCQFQNKHLSCPNACTGKAQNAYQPVMLISLGSDWTWFQGYFLCLHPVFKIFLCASCHGDWNWIRKNAKKLPEERTSFSIILSRGKQHRVF